MSQWLLAQFQNPKRLLAAVRALRERGHHQLDLHTPYPIPGADEALGLAPSPVPLFTLLGALGGVAGAYLIQWFCAAIDYPLNVGDRPLHSAPAFIPITFESGVLGASLCTVIALFVLFGFPRLHHPVFESDAFCASASNDRFWVSIALGEGSEVTSLTAELEALGAVELQQVADPKSGSHP
jgi:hypothetical protein